jgi:hypothetical protein
VHRTGRNADHAPERVCRTKQIRHDAGQAVWFDPSEGAEHSILQFRYGLAERQESVEALLVLILDGSNGRREYDTIEGIGEACLAKIPRRFARDQEPVKVRRQSIVPTMEFSQPCAWRRRHPVPRGIEDRRILGMLPHHVGNDRGALSSRSGSGRSHQWPLTCQRFHSQSALYVTPPARPFLATA